MNESDIQMLHLAPLVGFRMKLDLDPKRMSDYILNGYDELPDMSLDKNASRYEDKAFPEPYDPIVMEFMEQAEEAISNIRGFKWTRAGKPWTIVHEKHQCTFPHDHVESEVATRRRGIWAAVYWAKCNEGNGDLTLWPLGINNLNHMLMIPEEGYLFVFPGWIIHGVRANTVDEKRVSVSFNLDVQLEEDTPYWV